MNLQEVLNLKEEDRGCISGVTLDGIEVEDFLEPPEWLTEIGFVLVLEEDNLIQDKLLDIIIHYNFSKVSVTLEIPTQLVTKKLIDLDYLLQLSTNVDFNLSFLPPGHLLVGDEVTIEDYANLMGQLGHELCSRQNFDKAITPVSNFIDYLMLETLIGKNHPLIQGFTPRNQYIIKNFSTILTVEDSDLFKSKIREAVYSYYGGKEQLYTISYHLYRQILDKSKTMMKTHIEKQLIKKNKLSDSEQDEDNESNDI